MSNFFSRKPPPTAKEVSKGVKKDVKRSQRDIEREISSLEREEKNLIVEIKKSAQRGNDASTKVLAKQLVGLRKQRERMISSKAHIGAVGMRATAMAANAAVCEAVEKSAGAMSQVNAAVNPAQIASQMKEFQKQSEIMNMSEEMMDESLIDMFDGEEDEAEADGVVDKVLAEIGLDLDGKLADAPTAPVQQAEPQVAEPEAPADESVDELFSRLKAL